MVKKQSISTKLDNPYIFITISIIVVFLAFIIFSPRISSAIFPFKRQMELSNFTNQAKSENRIDPRRFWEFREFYSPGFFKFSNQGINESESSSLLSDFKINPQNVNIYFSKFDSKNLDSLDGLTTKTKINEILNKNDLDVKQTLFENSNTLIYKNSNDQTYIIFILPITEMKKANGFFDYTEDKKILQGKNWIDITKINN